MSVDISAQTVKELRERTGAGVMDCRRALTEAGGDLKKAEVIIAERFGRGPKDPTRATKQGLVEAYIHHGGQTGSLIELNCETDFVARTDDFRTLAKEIALQVAGMPDTKYVDRESIPAADLEEQRTSFAEALGLSGAELDKRLDQWAQEVALLEQPYVRDSKLTIRQLILNVGAKTGENIRVGRFVRYRIGG